ncbi:reverse transcriptase domain-containing protein [Tanacetum coccineum]|uniref:Reverse transcriptase domain-containing protein n=1 Tax=Tanacetum coccineum TaxID=301880 RepID=A0ABQ5EXL7_9ASTR
MATNAQNAPPEGNLPPATETARPPSELYLDELTQGVTGTINVMICRSWDVHTVTGRYVSTDFVMSDAKGNAIHGSAKANVAHNFLKLKEGFVYSIKNFVVQANREEYRIFRDDPYMIELDGAASVRRLSVKGGGFVRYPFQLIELASIELTDNKYLIDVAGYVTNVGRITYQKSGSRTLDFSLANGSGQAIRVTLWGGLGDALIEKKTSNVGLYPVVMTAMNVKLYNSKEPCPLSFLFKDEVTLSQDAVHADYSQAKEGTLENLLIWARNRKNDSTTFKCKVKIDGIRTRKGWNFPSCRGEKCKKGVVRREGSFWCQAYEKVFEYPVLRYRLELDVPDKTASTVVVMFDEPAIELVKCTAYTLASADEDVGFGYADDAGLPRALANIVGTIQTMEIKTQSYYEHRTFESFTCWRLAAQEVVAEDVGSTNTPTSPDENIKKSRRVLIKPGVATPSKPTEEKGKRVDLDDSDEEATCDLDDDEADVEGQSGSATKKKKRYIVDESASE